MMDKLTTCLCGSENIEIKIVSKTISSHTTDEVIKLNLQAEVCMDCGETYFGPNEIGMVSEAMEKLKQNEFQFFIEVDSA